MLSLEKENYPINICLCSDSCSISHCLVETALLCKCKWIMQGPFPPQEVLKYWRIPLDIAFSFFSTQLIWKMSDLDSVSVLFFKIWAPLHPRQAFTAQGIQSGRLLVYLCHNPYSRLVATTLVVSSWPFGSELPRASGIWWCCIAHRGQGRNTSMLSPPAASWPSFFLVPSAQVDLCRSKGQVGTVLIILIHNPVAAFCPYCCMHWWFCKLECC